MRSEHSKPRYAVWENVKGALTSNHGGDFRRVLEEICRVKDPAVSIPGSEKWELAGEILGDDYSVAWRVLDAQYWGVPQRRERIFLVADFDGQSAGKILFESEGLSGYSAESFKAWQAFAGSIEGSAGETGNGRYCLNPQGSSDVSVTEEKTQTLVAQDHGHHPAVLQAGGFDWTAGAKARGTGYVEEKAPTLRTQCQIAVICSEPSYGIGRHGWASGKNAQFTFAVYPEASLTLVAAGPNAVAESADKIKAFGICSARSNSMLSGNPNSGIYEAKISKTLDSNGGRPDCAQGGICVVEQGIIQPAYAATSNGFINTTKEKTTTITANESSAHHVVIDHDIRADDPAYIVRRLTPTECARLQGFPDWWCSDLGTEDPTEEEIAFWEKVFETHREVISHCTKPKTRSQIIKWLKNPYSEGSEYKMWGNGVALPCVTFIMSGIAWSHAEQEKEKDATVSAGSEL